jgi:hypothetical protein
MTNAISKKEYDEIKDKLITVESYNKETGKRTLTYGGLSYKQAIEEILKKQAEGNVCLVVPSANTSGLRTEKLVGEEDNIDNNFKAIRKFIAEKNEERFREEAKEKGHGKELAQSIEFAHSMQ